MEQHFFILLFFTGFVPLTLPVPHKYYLIQQGEMWISAQAYCKVNHSDLAIIESNNDMIRLQNEAQRQQFSSSAWIGLWNDVNSWYWSYGYEPLGNMIKWAAIEPNNKYGNQECVAIVTTGWSDRTCTETFPFLCFDDRETGNSRYIYYSQLKSWYDAQSYCRQYHTDLASTRDATEYSVVYNLVTSLTTYTWIGLTRHSWKWTDQTNFSTISWMPGKPDNALGNENCGFLNNSQAIDAKCSDVMPFFCYSVITGKMQVIRITVQSSQDMNDPAVMSATLEQIKQKWKALGLADDITVRWRVRSQGAVFQKK
ncbi:putative C-type lectin domain family 20 member A [Tachysurus fulvidraco]|uniref:putative C-type lectin domain family 20 member A n=1 Tax=Tachysurus fulvidraco TaxID=1234273 RepID=UPI001FEF83D1|nr:putative C-type lectin domain family 20 member A [Tachysurus fulvidraco]